MKYISNFTITLLLAVCVSGSVLALTVSGKRISIENCSTATRHIRVNARDEVDPTSFTTKELSDIEEFYNSQQPTDQVAYWKTLMPVPKDQGQARAEARKELPTSWLEHQFQDERVTKYILETARPVTELYGKNYEILIIKYNKPVLFVDSDALLVLTTELLQQLQSDDELLFLIAHEIAHSIFNEKSKAIKEILADHNVAALIHDLAVIELSCDAIAARTLLHLGRDARAFADLNDKLDRSYKHEWGNYHPAASVRRSLVENLTRSSTSQAHQSNSLKAIKSALYLALN